MRLRPQSQLDAAVREHVETNHYADADGSLYEPSEPPDVPGWGEDGDEPRSDEEHDTTQEVDDA